MMTMSLLARVAPRAPNVPNMKRVDNTATFKPRMAVKRASSRRHVTR
jgi:hypothetical protein